MKRRSELFSGVLFLLSAALFVLSQPSFLFEDGLSFLAWLSYVPFFLLVGRLSVKKSFLWGAAHGALSYFCLCWWVSAFGAAALSFVCALLAFYTAAMFFLISFSDYIFPLRLARFFWIFRALIVLSVEFLRSRGVLGFSYGIIGYSQWRNPALLRLSSFFGVMGVTCLILLTSSFVAKIISDRNLRGNLRGIIVFALVFAGILISHRFAGSRSPKKIARTFPVALIQNASSAKSSGIDDYERDVIVLKRLSDEALLQNPGTTLVVWPETAVVPDIILHSGNDADGSRHELAESLTAYFKSRGSAFLIGNNHLDAAGEHNSALYFPAGSGNVSVYNKIHLVPFAEFWPAFLDFGMFDRIKSSIGCDFFVAGEEVRVFELDGLRFGTPICFEDSFPDLLGQMRRMGASFFVNISDDAWAMSCAAQKMHLTMSVFRCAEFRTPMVRSAVDGKTCVIDSDGKILSSIESGEDAFLCWELDVPEESFSLYFLIGDAPARLIVLFVLSFLLILSVRFAKVKVYGGRKAEEKPHRFRSGDRI